MTHDSEDTLNTYLLRGSSFNCKLYKVVSNYSGTPLFEYNTDFI